jgi:transcriptional regulator of NAD metabolism
VLGLAFSSKKKQEKNIVFREEAERMCSLNSNVNNFKICGVDVIDENVSSNNDVMEFVNKLLLYSL